MSAAQHTDMALLKIISGGQTGVDRGALDAALAAHFPCGGWCPADRSAEDGSIPDRYPLTPLPRGGYRTRTRRNVEDSDGTAILAPGGLTGGTCLTWELCRRCGKPHLVIDAAVTTVEAAAEEVVRFILDARIGVLNVSGPRASGWAAGSAYAERVTVVLLKKRDGSAGA